MKPVPSLPVQFSLVILGLIVGALTQFTIDTDPTIGISSVLLKLYKLAYDWQTLITGLVAIAAAWWTYSTAQRQTEIAKKIEDDHIERERKAARALLPMTLSAIVEYSQECMKALVADSAGGTPKYPILPPSTLEGLRDCLRYENDDVEAASRMVALAEWLQVHEARLRRIKTEDVGDIEYLQGIEDAVTLQTLAEDLFEYARQGENRISRPKITKKDIKRSLSRTSSSLSAKLSKIYDQLHPQEMATAQAPAEPTDEIDIPFSEPKPEK